MSWQCAEFIGASCSLAIFVYYHAYSYLVLVCRIDFSAVYQVTSVGATQLNNPVFANPQPTLCSANGFNCASGAGGQEVAVVLADAGFTTGGGFANFSAAPAYQQLAIHNYFNSSVQLPPAPYYNASGRGLPDIAAIGYHNAVVFEGGVTLGGGTSASTPVAAAIIALLNKAVIAKTGKPLGFANPFLYQAAEDDPANFNDITVGDNKCTESSCATSCQGFYATKGWVSQRTCTCLKCSLVDLTDTRMVAVVG